MNARNRNPITMLYIGRLPVAFIMLVWLLPLGTLNAAETGQPLRVGISSFSPFVMTAGREPKGLSIDVWDALSKYLKLDYVFVPCAGVGDKLRKLQEGNIDAAIGGITITEDRERHVDFTHPVYHTGLDILVLDAQHWLLLDFLASMLTGEKLFLVLFMLLLFALAGHVIWLVERSPDGGKTAISPNYIPGVFEGMYWALITASTIGYGDKVPHKWTGRIVAGVLILIFLPLFAFFIAHLSSDLTMHKMTVSIQGPEDLWGKRVGVLKGTTSQEYADRIQARLYAFDSAAEAYGALLSGMVDAVVYDAPESFVLRKS